MLLEVQWTPEGRGTGGRGVFQQRRMASARPVTMLRLAIVTMQCAAALPATKLSCRAHASNASSFGALKKPAERLKSNWVLPIVNQQHRQG